MSGAIDVHALARAFGDKRAVDGVDLSVAAGEIYGFLGPNGAGKSTMVRMLTTLLAPTGGSARVAGFDVTTDAEKVRLRIGVALQDAALDGKQTGRELLDLQGRLYGLPKAERLRRLTERKPSPGWPTWLASRSPATRSPCRWPTAHRPSARSRLRWPTPVWRWKASPCALPRSTTCSCT
ncbi:MAG: ATP-binding cassette domain-containing protein [Ilumatobacteraceae bacterium]